MTSVGIFIGCWPWSIKGHTSELHIYIYIWSEIFRSPDRAKSEACKYGGHGGSKLRRFQSPCAIFTIRVNMKDRVGRLRRRKLGPPLAAIFGFTRWPEDLTTDIYRAHWDTHTDDVKSTSDHVSRLVFLFSCPKNSSVNHLNFYCMKQIDYIFSCVCTVIDHRRHHSV